jgi:flagellar basal body P-ring formation protein FlgA
MIMKHLAPMTCAFLLLATARSPGEDSFGRLLEPAYVPDGGSNGRARVAPPSMKGAAPLITANELLDRLKTELVKQCPVDGELRLSFDRPWQTIRVPSDDWQVTLPELPIGGLSKAFLLRVRITVGERAWFDQSLVVQAQLWRPVLVATRRLERGQTLDATAAEVQPMDVLRERITPVSATTRLEDQEVLQNVVEGRPLTVKDIAAAPLVRKGSVVEVIAGDAGMAITMKGLAMGTGGAGDAITIRNMDTHKDFSARVVSRNSVHVSF